MSAPCPKCGHIRTAEDTGPDYACPSCGVVYAKYLASLHARAAQQATQATPEPVLTSAQGGAPARGVRRWANYAVGAVFAVMLLGTIVGGDGDSEAETLRGSGAAPASPAAAQQPAVAAPVPRANLPAAPAVVAPKTEEELEQERVDRLTFAAREACFAAIKAHALYPSSVDIAWFTGTVTMRQAGATVVRAAFTSKNALGNTLPFDGYCRVTDDGKLTSYDQKPR